MVFALINFLNFLVAIGVFFYIAINVNLNAALGYGALFGVSAAIILAIGKSLHVRYGPDPDLLSFAVGGSPYDRAPPAVIAATLLLVALNVILIIIFTA